MDNQINNNRFAALDDDVIKTHNVIKIEDDMIAKYYRPHKSVQEFGRAELDKQRLDRLRR